MKKETLKTRTTIRQDQNDNLAYEVKETVQVNGKRNTHFSTIDLWNIQNGYRTGFSRRYH